MLELIPFMSEVLIDLSVEGEGPCKKVDPSDDLNDQILPILHVGCESILLL